MINKKKIESKVSAKNSITKEVTKTSDKTSKKKSSDCLKVFVDDKNGSKSYNIILADADLPLLCKTAGFRAYNASKALIKIGINAVVIEESDAEAVANLINDYLAMMSDLSPTDGFEGMLITQMVATFKQAMNYLQRANSKNNIGNSDIQDALLNRSVKLMRLYNQQLEALDKHRRKGSQKMTVEHVHVHEGGQAIVGEFHQGGG